MCFPTPYYGKMPPMTFTSREAIAKLIIVLSSCIWFPRMGIFPLLVLGYPPVIGLERHIQMYWMH